MSSDQFSDLEFPPLVGDFLYRDTDKCVRYFPIHADDPYAAMDAMSRMQLKILGLYLSELQDQIRLRTSKRRAPVYYDTLKGAPDGTT